MKTRQSYYLIALFVLLWAALLSGCGTLEAGIASPATPDTDNQSGPTRYENPDYGFSFHYPTGWTLSQEPHILRLVKNNLTLTIAYRRASEAFDLSLGRMGRPAGEFIYGDKLTFAGQPIPVQYLVYEKKYKMVIYGPEKGPLSAGDLQFSLWLEDLSTPDYEAIDLNEAQLAEVTGILESFEVSASITSLTEPTLTPWAETWPPDEGPIPVTGWYGSVAYQGLAGGKPYRLELLPEGAGSVDLLPTSPEIAAQIEELSGKEPPNQHAHFWGEVTCTSDSACTLEVSRLRPDGPGGLYSPDPVVGWQGSIHTNPAWAQIDDAFQAAGRFPVHYGIWSDDPGVAQQIEELRNTGVEVLVWGQVQCGVMDANGCQIQVNHIERLTAEPVDLSQSFQNEAYMFEFAYPVGWVILDDTPSDGQAPRLLLTRSGAVLEIAYRRTGENLAFPTETLPAGVAQEVLPAGQLTFLDRILTRYQWEAAGTPLAVVFSESQPDTASWPLVTSRDLEFRIIFHTAARSSGLSPELLSEADAILASFRRLP